MTKVLVVEDQKRHLDSLRRGLEAEGYDVVTASTGEAGLAEATGNEIDAIVLDLMLPGRDGMGVLRELRSCGFTKPILILSARDSVEDRVEGLDEGANDYLVKPFAFAELLARLRALSRRELPGRPLVLEPMTSRWICSIAECVVRAMSSSLPDANSNCSNTFSGTRMKSSLAI